MKQELVAKSLWKQVSPKVFDREGPNLQNVYANFYAEYVDPASVSKSADYKEGAIANEIEWSKTIIHQLAAELVIDHATSWRLDEFGKTLRLLRHSLEIQDDDAYRERLKLYIGPCKNGTPFCILSLIRPFLQSDPIFLDGKHDVGYYGVSFYDVWEFTDLEPDVYPSIYAPTNEGYYFEIWITPITGGYNEYTGFYNLREFSYYDFSFYSSIFGFLGTTPADIIERIEICKAAGIDYNVFLKME